MNIENLDENEKLILENGCLDKEDDKQDERDYQLASIMPEAVVPESFICQNMSPVNHQIYPSCTSEATIKGTKEQQEKVSNLSEGFNYRNTKKLSGLYDIGGDYIYRTLQAVCKFGVCENHLFPKPNRSMSWQDYVKLTPSEEAFKNAEKYKGKTYWSMDKGAEHFRGALSTFKTPIIFAMGWYRSYRDCKGVLPLPKDWFANHCVVAVGYDEDYLIVKNSYGENWGDKGYFKIPFKDWDKHKIYHPYILLDINKPNNKKMKLKIDSSNNQYLVDENSKFGVSIADEEMLCEIANHYEKLGMALGEPEKTDMTPYYIVHGSSARKIKEFFNL